MSHKVDLESEDYYIREIAYEEEKTAIENALKNESIEITLNETHVVFQVPESVVYEDIQIEMNRPNNSKLDQKFNVVGTKTFMVDKKKLENGQYNIFITYLDEGEACLQKDKIYI